MSQNLRRYFSTKLDYPLSNSPLVLSRWITWDRLSCKFLERLLESRDKVNFPIPCVKCDERKRRLIEQKFESISSCPSTWKSSNYNIFVGVLLMVNVTWSRQSLAGTQVDAIRWPATIKVCTNSRYRGNNSYPFPRALIWPGRYISRASAIKYSMERQWKRVQRGIEWKTNKRVREWIWKKRNWNSLI